MIITVIKQNNNNDCKDKNKISFWFKFKASSKQQMQSRILLLFEHVWGSSSFFLKLKRKENVGKYLWKSEHVGKTGNS